MPDNGTFASDMEWARAVDDRLRNIPTHADAVTHTARLVETHRITLSAGATGDNVAVARLHAEAYARAHGFELDACEFSVLGINGRTGVQFTVTLGVGDIHNDQRTPGVLDTWTWSARAQHWAEVLRRVFPSRGGRVMARPEGGVATVTPMPGVAFGDPHRPPAAGAGGGSGRVSGYLGAGITAGGAGAGAPGAGGAGGSAGWMGPVALRGFAEGGPVAGGGAQAGTGPLPPWLRRTDPSFDDTASEDTDPGPFSG